MDRIDIEKYNEGRRAFDDGLSLMSLAEKVIAAMGAPPGKAGDDAERQLFSYAIGFFDAGLDRLRGITV